MAIDFGCRKTLSVLLVLGGTFLMACRAPAEGIMNAVTHAAGLQGRLLWADAEANLQYLAKRDGVRELVENCRRANINALILDVKPLNGTVVYNSAIAPRVQSFRGFDYPKDYDLLATVVEIAHEAGLKVYAAVNVFSEGSQEQQSGPAYEHPEWQAIIYDVERWVECLADGDSGSNGERYPISAANKTPLPGRLAILTSLNGIAISARAVWSLVSADGCVRGTGVGADPRPEIPEDGYLLLAEGEAGEWLRRNAPVGKLLRIAAKPRLVPISTARQEHFAVFVNPVNPQVQEYELSVLKEIAGGYAVDGIVLDRMRYPNLLADFSDLSRTTFEKWLGKPVDHWPEDVLKPPLLPGRRHERGPLFEEWVEWRAWQIRGFFEKAVETVKSVRSDALVGLYVGSWYAEYYEVGVNWGSRLNRVPFDWASPNYHNTGLAELADFICTGAYYDVAWREDAREDGKPEVATVEAAGQLSTRVMADDTFTYASLYLLNYSGQPDAFRSAIEACLHTTQGVMIFDLVYVRNYNWWPLLEAAFEKPAIAPHDVPGLRLKAREIRDLILAAKAAER